jgi:hypothetical protein
LASDRSQTVVRVLRDTAEPPMILKCDTNNR